MTAATDQAEAVPAPQPGGHFFDSATYQFPPSAPAIMAYADNLQAQPPPDLRERYAHIHWITVVGGTGPRADHCQILDYEPGLPSFGQGTHFDTAARDWATSRIMRAERAIFYCDRANLHKLLVSVGLLIWTSQRTHFWIPTLDGVDWSAQQLADDIALHWGVSIPAARIWANQNMGSDHTGGPWDRSTLFGQW